MREFANDRSPDERGGRRRRLSLVEIWGRPREARRAKARAIAALQSGASPDEPGAGRRSRKRRHADERDRQSRRAASETGEIAITNLAFFLLGAAGATLLSRFAGGSPGRSDLCRSTARVAASGAAGAQARVALGLLALLGLATGLGGCIGQPQPSVVDDIDFAQVQRWVNITFDLTGATKDNSLYDTMRTRYGGAGIDLQFRTLTDVQLTYLLLSDSTAGTQLVAIPGTSDQENIRLDLEATLVPDALLGIDLHEGFRTAALSVLSDVRPLLRADQPVTVIGYSLGGGVAAILSAYLRQGGFTVQKVATFGQPKIAGSAASAVFGTLPLTRFVAADDPIPQLPGSQYTQFAREVTLLDGPYVAILDPADPDYDRSFTLGDDVFQVRRADHTTYPSRIASKEGVQVLAVPWADRAQYVDASAAAGQ